MTICAEGIGWSEQGTLTKPAKYVTVESTNSSKTTDPMKSQTPMNDEQLLRYSRQIMLPAVDIDGQTRLLNSKVFILGLGGLGSPCAMYLAAAGVGRLTLCDDDQVELSNLQRQIIHGTPDIGRRKTESAQDTLQRLNPETHVTLISKRLTRQELLHEVAHHDVVIDGSDNFATRFLVNEVCVAARVPLVSGAAIRMEGQITVFRNDHTDSPCYRCIYQDQPDTDQTCSENGVLSPILGIIGSIQALECVKILLNVGNDLQGRLVIFDGSAMEWRTIRVRKDKNCPVCAENSKVAAEFN